MTTAIIETSAPKTRALFPELLRKMDAYSRAANYLSVCDGLGFLGIEVEGCRNAANEGVISAAAGRVPVRVIRTDEERMMAEMVHRVLGLEGVR